MAIHILELDYKSRNTRWSKYYESKKARGLHNGCGKE